MVGLTTRYKKDDQLWFTFFHEVGHILLHRDRLSYVIDNPADYLGDDAVDPGMKGYEDEADHFATVTLVPPVSTEAKQFLKSHGKNLTNDEIHDFAESIWVQTRHWAHAARIFESSSKLAIRFSLCRAKSEISTSP